jgi:hypothetical protein
MALKHIVPIDLGDLELQNAKMQTTPTTSLPAASTKTGQFRFDSTAKRMKYSDGTNWIDLVAPSWDNIIGKPSFGSLALKDGIAYNDLTTKPTSEQIQALVGDYVTTFSGQTGAITVRGSLTANGSVNLAMSGKQLQASIVGLGTAAYKADTYFVAANTAITGATKCKITYDSKGLVTGGADLSASDIPNLSATKITSGTLSFDRLPSMYWANVAVSSSSSNQTEPYFKSITIGNGTKGVKIEYDATNDCLKINGGLYSTDFVSAYGYNSGGGGSSEGGGARLDSWSEYDATKATWYLSAGLGYDLYLKANTASSSITNLTTRLSTIESYFAVPDADDVLNKFQEIVTFLGGYSESSTLAGALGDKVSASDLKTLTFKLGTTAKVTYDTTSAASVAFSGSSTAGKKVSITESSGTFTFALTDTYAGGTAVTLNGTSKASSTASFYAPTASGTAGQLLVSGGANTAPSWSSTFTTSTIARVFRTAITGDGSTTEFTVTHNFALGTTIDKYSAHVQVYDASGNMVMTDVQAAGTSSCKIGFAAAPTSGTKYYVVVVA